MPIIDEWLTEDIPRKHKNKRTAVKIYSDLLNHSEYSKLLQVGRQTVLNYVNKKKAEIYSKTYQTAMFTRHAMCEAQVDFGDVTIVRPVPTKKAMSNAKWDTFAGISCSRRLKSKPMRIWSLSISNFWWLAWRIYSANITPNKS
jgi:hypothetical protein